MKNILFSLIFVLLSCSLWAQQQTDVLQQMEHRMHNDPIMEQYANPDQDRMLSGEMDFLLPNMKNTETDIQVDSVCYESEHYGAFKEIYTYHDDGNRLTYLQLYWTPGGTLVGNTLHSYTYDENGNNLTNLAQTWELSTWVNRELYTYTCDDNGNMLTFLVQNFENNAWENNWLLSYTYNIDGNRLTYLRRKWDNTFWVNSNSQTCTYDTDENMLTKLSQKWENDAWKNDWLDTHTYDTDGNMLTFLMQKWENEAWKNYLLYTYSYDDNGNKLTSSTQHWSSGDWINSSFSTFTYDQNSNKLSSLYQSWENNTFVDKILIYYTYDANGNRLTRLTHNWENGSWLKYENNVYHFLSGEVKARSYNWDGSNWMQSNSSSFNIVMGGKNLFHYSATILEFYYSDGTTGIEDPQTNSENSPILCYPNPVTDQINIEIDPAWQAKNYRLELFSQTGQKVKSFEISSTIGSSIAPIKVDDIPPGLYLLRIEVGKKIFSQKIIMSK